MTVFFCHVLRILVSDFDAPLKNTAQVSRKVFPEAQDILRDGSGDLLENRFVLIMKNDGFHD